MTNSAVPTTTETRTPLPTVAPTGTRAPTLTPTAGFSATPTNSAAPTSTVHQPESTSTIVATFTPTMPTASPTPTRRAGFNVHRRQQVPNPPGPIAPGGPANQPEPRDLVVGGGDRPHLLFLRNDGDGSFTVLPPLIISNVNQAGFGALATADVDGDGELDVAGTLPESNLVVVVFGDPARGLGEVQRFPVAGAPRHVRLADVTGDAVPDIVVTTDVGLMILAGTAEQGFRPPLLVVSGGGIRDLVVADVDGDGIGELFLARSDGVEVRFGDGRGGFPSTGRRFLPGAAGAVAVADVTGDGRADLAIARSDVAAITVFSALPAGIGGVGVTTATGTVSDLTPADVDGNGVSELLLLDTQAHMVTVLFGDADGALRHDASLNIGPDAVPELAVTDVVGSIPPDFVLAEPNLNQLIIVRNDTPPATGPTITPISAITCEGDCNEDASVTIDELMLTVGIALGELDASACEPADSSGDGVLAINELVHAVGRLLHGCDGTSGLALGVASGPVQSSDLDLSAPGQQ